MKPSLLYNTVAQFFMILFTYTGLAKIMEMSSLRQETPSSPIWGSMAGLVAWAPPILEILIVIILFIPAWRLRGLCASFILMGIFTLYVLGMMFTDDHLSCSCGGIVESLSSREHLLFNGACIVLAWIGIRAGRNRNHESKLTTTPWLNVAVTFLLFGFISWIVLTAATTPVLRKTGIEGRPLPNFDLLLLDNITHMNTKDIPLGKPFIIIGFSPYCPHCQREIRDITHNIQKFDDTHIYLVTYFPMTDLRKFYDGFRLARYPNITAGVDNKDAFLLYFKQHTIPFTAIYNGKKKLTQEISGRADLPSLLRCIND